MSNDLRGLSENVIVTQTRVWIAEGLRGQLPHLRLRLLEPEPHVHLAVHGRRGGEMLFTSSRFHLQQQSKSLDDKDDKTHPNLYWALSRMSS